MSFKPSEKRNALYFYLSDCAILISVTLNLVKPIAEQSFPHSYPSFVISILHYYY